MPDSTPATAQEEGLKAATYEDGYSQGQADAAAEHKWVQDKAWMDAVLMFNHYDRLAAMTWLVGVDDAAAKRDEWRRNISSLAGTKSVEDINALAAWNLRVPAEGESGIDLATCLRSRGLLEDGENPVVAAVLAIDHLRQERAGNPLADFATSFPNAVAHPAPSVPAAPAASAPEGEHTDWYAEAIRQADIANRLHKETTAQAERIRELEGAFGDDLVLTGCRDRADLIDMANVGKALLERIADDTKGGAFQGWAPMDSPVEIVTDLLNALDEATAERDALKAALRQIKLTALSATHAVKALTHIVRLCIDAGVPEGMDALAALTTPSKETGR